VASIGVQGKKLGHIEKESKEPWIADSFSKKESSTILYTLK
jgi:hypothetical protein